MPELEAITIYDAKAVVKHLSNKEINVEQAVSEARLLFHRRARQLGKLGICRWMRGLKALKANCVLTSVGRSI